MGTTSSTLVYSLMQSRRRADKSRKHLLNLEDLFSSNSITLKEYLKSASAMGGKVVGHNKETSNDDQADTNELLPEAEDVDI